MMASFLHLVKSEFSERFYSLTLRQANLSV